nr:hypothetical protein [Tanacetum cinerariifolium]
MSTPTFAKTHNLIAYLEKPTESEGYEQIIDFLNGSSVKYALTVNDEVRIQALVDGKRVNIKESSIRRILRLHDAEAPEKVGILQADAQPLPTSTEPSTSKPQKKHKPKRKHTKEPKVPPTESQAKHNVPLPSPSHDPLTSGEDSLKLKELMDLCTNLSNKVLDLESKVLDIKFTYKEKFKKLKSRESSKQGRKVAYIDADVEINLEKVQAEAYNLDLDHQEKVLSMLDVNDEEPGCVEEVLEVVKAAKLIIEVVTTAGLMQVQIDLDEEVARQLEAELNADINWNAMIEQVKRSERLIDEVMKYQALKRKSLTEAQARRNMIVYLKNMVGYKMNYFKGMSYDEIRPLFEKHYNYNQTFLNEVNEGIKIPKKEVRQEKEVEVESSKREGESLEQEIAKKQKMEQETEELKKCLQIVPDDDDVYADATLLASKIPIVDYKIHTKRNRPYFKIIRAHGNHRLFLSFSTMLKNFDREDLESLWKIIRERFEKTEPKNYTDDYLLNTLKIMFEKHNVEANIFLLVEKMYHLIHFTLEQMVNDVRLEVDDESEISLELLRLVRRQLNEGCGGDDDVVGKDGAVEMVWRWRQDDEGGVVEMVWRWRRDDEGIGGWWLCRGCGGSLGGMAINHGRDDRRW